MHAENRLLTWRNGLFVEYSTKSTQNERFSVDTAASKRLKHQASGAELDESGETPKL
jgi:hypothetical protein